MDVLPHAADIRRRTGRDPIQSTTIDGFDSDQPPPPPNLDVPQIRHDDDPDEEWGQPAPSYQPPEIPPSPLIPRSRVELEPQSPDLVVKGRVGFYKKRSVNLNEIEEAKIAAILLGAMKREVREQAREVDALIPRRTRKRTKKVKPA